MAKTHRDLSGEYYDELFNFLVNELGEYAIISLDKHNKIRTWNRGVQRVLGYRRKEFIGQSGSIIFTPEDRKKKADVREQRLAAKNGRASDERWHLRKDGKRFWGSGVMCALRDPQGNLDGFVKIMRDDTSRREAEQALRLSHETLEARVKARTRDLLAQQEQLRTIARELSRAEQHVRQHIAAELHDEVAQLLVVCKFSVAALRGGITSPRDRKEADRALSGLSEAIDRVRSIMSGLSPVAIDERNLRGVIDWAIDTTRESGLHVRVDDDGRRKPMHREMLVLLGNIVRELLVNVSKHAQTKTANISLRRMGDNAVVTVRDSGLGFKVSARSPIAKRNGFGLFSVRERLQLMDGRMELRSKPGKGTIVVLTAPLQKAAGRKRARRQSRK